MVVAAILEEGGSRRLISRLGRVAPVLGLVDATIGLIRGTFVNADLVIATVDAGATRKGIELLFPELDPLRVAALKVYACWRVLDEIYSDLGKPLVVTVRRLKSVSLMLEEQEWDPSPDLDRGNHG